MILTSTERALADARNETSAAWRLLADLAAATERVLAVYDTAGLGAPVTMAEVHEGETWRPETGREERLALYERRAEQGLPIFQSELEVAS